MEDTDTPEFLLTPYVINLFFIQGLVLSFLVTGPRIAIMGLLGISYTYRYNIIKAYSKIRRFVSPPTELDEIKDTSDDLLIIQWKTPEETHILNHVESLMDIIRDTEKNGTINLRFRNGTTRQLLLTA
tara:strand:+ start:834 stop:1217 length:384 start_codon:yes stop_codon:yes gene_type:complete